jgi:hypothetical protein
MNRITTAIVAASCLLALYNCKPRTDEQSASADSMQADAPLPAAQESETPHRNYPIHYQGAEQNDVYQTLTTFTPLQAVYAAAERSINFEDSIINTREGVIFSGPEDSLLALPLRNKAYDAIMDYKRQAESGLPSSTAPPHLLKLRRVPDAEDSSSLLLPEATSSFLSSANFFFLGGAPFIYKPYSEKDTIYTDPSGRPETRFKSLTTENGIFALTSLAHFKREAVRVRFGPKLDFYNGHSWHAKGIGSITHEFVHRIPVLFLTENGFVPASLIDIIVKVYPESLGCVSDQPILQFACPQNLEPQQILAIYVPYDQTPLTSCKIARPNSDLWTADLNDDGIPDLACVSSTFAGGISDTMAECLWYININGVWQVIDWAHELDCT